MDSLNLTQPVSTKTSEPKSKSETTPLATDVVDSNATADLLEVAESYFDSGLLDKAEQVLQQMILQKTEAPRVFYLLGAIYYDKGKHQRAEIALRRALDMDPSYRDAAIALTILYNELGQYDKAESLYKTTRENVELTDHGKDQHLMRLFSQKHEHLGDLYVEHERYQDAYQEYEKASQHLNTELSIQIKAAKALEKTGASKAAIEKLRELKSAFPEYIAGRLTLGMFYFNAHRIPEAIAEWEAILKREPNHKEAKLYLKVAAQTQMTSL